MKHFRSTEYLDECDISAFEGRCGALFKSPVLLIPRAMSLFLMIDCNFVKWVITLTGFRFPVNFSFVEQSSHESKRQPSVFFQELFEKNFKNFFSRTLGLFLLKAVNIASLDDLWHGWAGTTALVFCSQIPFSLIFGCRLKKENSNCLEISSRLDRNNYADFILLTCNFAGSNKVDAKQWIILASFHGNWTR